MAKFEDYVQDKGSDPARFAAAVTAAPAVAQDVLQNVFLSVRQRWDRGAATDFPTPT